ncbi:hypothetical protein DFH07DRAFT_909123 [Mycena maculata]|uniref:Uncharacterized protein n=1 Tax=Mycena maculata TaxID=230809 RepID=A0AAD7KBA3_9AGAR|nr:hypothetical protein DFH07DRAFT_909123 [Mycena maculata]
MDTIPPEIWTEVFSFACTDDGSTGRALSTVSRVVHITSRPVKYQSLCVVGPKQLLKLSAVLSALPPSARKVKYLFVADGSKDYADPDDSAEAHRQLFEYDPSKDVAEQALFHWILDLVSSSLVALHIHCTKIHRRSLLPEIELPVLSDLTLHGPCTSHSPAPTGPPNRVLFPSLRSMHIYHFAYCPSKFLEQILETAPSLEHLHVPQRSFSPYEIQVALGILQPIASSDETRLPSALERLVIEVDPVPETLDSWAKNIRGEQHVRKLQKISQRDGRLRMVDGRNSWIPIGRAKREWLENFHCPVE